MYLRVNLDTKSAQNRHCAGIPWKNMENFRRSALKFPNEFFPRTSPLKSVSRSIPDAYLKRVKPSLHRRIRARFLAQLRASQRLPGPRSKERGKRSETPTVAPLG